MKLLIAALLAIFTCDTLAQTTAPAVTKPPLRIIIPCKGYTISKKGDDVLIRCPGLPDPWLIFKPCPQPTVVRRDGDFSVYCYVEPAQPKK